MPTAPGAAGAHELGQTAQTSLRYRHRPLPELRRQLKIVAAIEDPPVIVRIPTHLGLPTRAPAARPGAASRFIPDNLRAENRLPTQADGAARSEFERAARSGTLRAPPTTTPPKPAEATPGFSSNRKGIDNSPVRRYCSGQKKRWFEFPIHHTPVRNNFNFKPDPTGSKCPFQAHIRKSNPRGESVGSFATNLAEERSHIMPRRGITYGHRAVHPNDPVLDEHPELIPTEGVGLLFMAYQNDIANQFEFTQRNWVNNSGFLKLGIGIDPVLGQVAEVPRTGP